MVVGSCCDLLDLYRTHLHCNIWIFQSFLRASDGSLAFRSFPCQGQNSERPAANKSARYLLSLKDGTRRFLPMRILSNRTHVTLLHTLASLLAAPSVLFSTRIPEAASAISQTIEVMRLSVSRGTSPAPSCLATGSNWYLSSGCSERYLSSN